MKKKLLLNYLSILFLIFITGCSKGSGQGPLEDAQISIQLKMPEDFAAEGVKGSLAYYWNPNMKFQFYITQENEVVHSGQLSPSTIPSDGQSVVFDIKPDEEKFDRQKPFKITGVVSTTSAANVPVTQGQLVYPEGWNKALPFDILSAINIPLSVSVEGQMKDSKSVLEETLQPTGKLMYVQVANRSKYSIQPLRFYLTSDKEVFIDQTGTFSSKELKYEGKYKKSTSPFTFSENDIFSPQFRKTYILWMPTDTDLGNVSVSTQYQYRNANSSDAFTNADSTTPEAIHINSDQKIIVISLSEDKAPIEDKPITEEANTSGGGDPLFSMDDIEFWVGEGSKRSALVIEWHDNKGPDALVWGYRWDGEKTGEQMVHEIIKADPRLSALVGKAFGGLHVVGGLGYQFEKTTPRASIYLDNTAQVNDGNGITYVETSKDFDKFTFGDPKAHWKSGFYTNGYWVYYTKNNRIDSWKYSNLVYSLRKLKDGSWDGWSFQDGMESYNGRVHGSKFLPAKNPNI